MRLFPAKLLMVTCEVLAKPGVVGILDKHGVSGYTSYEVDGRGSRGTRGQGLSGDRNVRIDVVLSEARCGDVVEELARTMFSDYAMIVNVCDTGVVRPEKFS